MSTATVPAQQRKQYSAADIKDGMRFTTSGGTGILYRTSLRTDNTIFIRTVGGNDTGRFYSCAYVAMQFSNGTFILC